MAAFKNMKDCHVETELNLSCVTREKSKINWWMFQDVGLTLYRQDLFNNHSFPKLVAAPRNVHTKSDHNPSLHLSYFCTFLLPDLPSPVPLQQPKKTIQNTELL